MVEQNKNKKTEKRIATKKSGSHPPYIYKAVSSGALVKMNQGQNCTKIRNSHAIDLGS